MSKIWEYSFKGLKFLLIVTGIMFLGYDILKLIFHFNDPNFSSNTWKKPPEWTWEIVPVLLFGALIEEIIFRIIPMTISRIVGEYFNIKKLWIFIAIISSLIFGFLHGNITNIFFQGISGFFFCWLWIKVSYDRDLNKSNAEIFWFFPSIVTWLTHFLFNMTVVIMAYLEEYVINIFHKI